MTTAAIGGGPEAEGGIVALINSVPVEHEVQVRRFA